MSDRKPAENSRQSNLFQSGDRRRFMKTVGGAAVAGVVGSMLFDSSMVHAAEPTSMPGVDTKVAEFYSTLSDTQKKAICFGYDHALRKRISANWNITKPTVGDDFYTDAQRELINGILKSITTDEGYDRLVEQMEYDDGGVGSYSVAVFGAPGEKLQWELTGRHLTLRADGDLQDKAGFGGPIVYGHAEEVPSDNLYHYQTKATNEVFAALDPKQVETALIEKAPKESDVQIQGEKGKFPGVAVSDLSSDQKELVEKTLKILLAPYRPADVDEVMAIVKENGGVDKLHMAFYKQGDLRNDKVWDIWRVEGPSFVWHFRGAPHVHAYINIGAMKTEEKTS